MEMVYQNRAIRRLSLESWSPILISRASRTPTFFLEADCKAKVFTRAGEFVDVPLHCCLGVRANIVSEEHVTPKYSFDFVLGAEASQV